VPDPTYSGTLHPYSFELRAGQQGCLHLDMRAAKAPMHHGPTLSSCLQQPFGILH